MPFAADLDAWIAAQARHSATAMEQAISATRLVRRREAFGQVMVPAPGSVLASPVIADWDPEPDYFFHWVRDSAIVMRSVAELMQDSASAAERRRGCRSEEHTSELQSLMRISYAVFCLKKNKNDRDVVQTAEDGLEAVQNRHGQL